MIFFALFLLLEGGADGLEEELHQGSQLSRIQGGKVVENG